MRWWQKKVRGWIVPIWYSDRPIVSYRWSKLSKEQKKKIVDKIRESKQKT